MSGIARVPERGTIPLRVLALAMRMDREWMEEQGKQLVENAETLQAEIKALIGRLDSLGTKITGTMEKALTLSANVVPVWDDTYNLCGDPDCSGDCHVCQDGEYIEEDHTEKYCRRGRR